MSYQYQPLGTIVSSILNYDLLCQSIGEQASIDLKKSSYVPCDGRSVVGSQLHTLTGNAIASSPDLRGKFIRGLNVIYSVGQPLPFDPASHGDPNGANRVAGDYQNDELQSHQHGYQRYNPATITNMSNDTDQRHCAGESGNSADSVGATGGAESRPRNIAVYFYIKIN